MSERLQEIERLLKLLNDLQEERPLNDAEKNMYIMLDRERDYYNEK